MEAFAAGAAVIIRNLLLGVSHNVGVAWGTTIWHVTQALRVFPPHRGWRSQAPVDFVPLCGDPLLDSSQDDADMTSSRIASDLSKIVNGHGKRSVWLGLVPAYIPRTFNDRDTKVIQKLIDLVPEYRRIFGPPHPSIAEDLHMVLTAAGPAERPVGFGQNPLLGLTAGDAKRLTRSIHGDIGGVLIPKLLAGGDSKPRLDPLVRDVARHWTGLRMEHLRACADQAFAAGRAADRPGVTLVSFSPNRTEIVLEAIRQGLVNQLIVSSDLERSLDAALPDVPEKARGEATESRR
jgi:hypothetical protein